MIITGLVIPGFSCALIEEEIFKANVLQIERVAKLPVEAMQATRNSVKLQNKMQLHQANDAECRLLVERWQSKECLGALMAFGERKK